VRRSTPPRLSVSKPVAKPVCKSIFASVPRAGKAVLLYAILAEAYILFWCQQHGGYYSLLLFALPSTIVLGSILWASDAGFRRLRAMLLERVAPAISGFLLLFACLIGYISMLSATVSYPLARIIGWYWGKPELGSDFALASVNLGLFIAIASWIGLVRSPRN